MPVNPSDRQFLSRTPIRSHPYLNQNQPPPPNRSSQAIGGHPTASTLPRAATTSNISRQAIVSKIRRAAAGLGIENVKPEQIDAITACAEHKDSIVTLPTGFGKSLCFQLVPLVMNGTVIVICPLIALAADQVRVTSFRSWTQGHEAPAIRLHLCSPRHPALGCCPALLVLGFVVFGPSHDTHTARNESTHH